MGVPIVKSSFSLSHIVSFKEEQELILKFKKLQAASRDMDDDKPVTPKNIYKNNQPVISLDKNRTSNDPIIQDIGLYLISEEEEINHKNINSPHILTVSACYKSPLESNDLQESQININNLNFNSKGAFSNELRQPQNQSLESCVNNSKTLYLTQNPICVNLTKTMKIFKSLFPKTKIFICEEFSFGSFIFGQNNYNFGLIAYLFQNNSQFILWETKKKELLKEILKIIKLQYLEQNPIIIEYLLNKLTIYSLKSLRKVIDTKYEIFTNLWKLDICDYDVSFLLNQFKEDEKQVNTCFIKALFKDITISAFLMSLNDISIKILQISHVFYIKSLNFFFLWFPFTSKPIPETLFSINSANQFFTEENYSTINNIFTLNTNPPLENNSFNELLDLATIKSNFNNNSNESFKLTEELSVEDKVPETLKCINTENNMNQNIEILGIFLKNLLEITGLDKNSSIGFMNGMNDETFFNFYENYYLNLSSLQSHKARNFLNFFVDLNIKRRIEFISLLHYLDADVLKPWKYLNITKSTMTSSNNKNCTCQFDYGLEYKGEFHLLKGKIILFGKGVLKNSDTGDIIYEGLWKENKFHGKGSLFLFGKDGYIYRGEFKNGKCHGEGTIFFRKKLIFTGNFSNNNYYTNLIQSSPLINDIIEDNFGCFVSFRNPVKEVILQQSGDISPSLKISAGLMAMHYEESENFDLIEVDLLKIKPKDTNLMKIGDWIIKKLKMLKHCMIIHCLKEENIWVIDGFDAITLRLKIRIYVSERPLIVRKMITILKSLKNIFEDFALKLWHSMGDSDHSENEEIIEEFSLKLYPLFKLKKIDFLESTSMGQGFRGKEVCEKFFNSFLLHKLKRMDLKLLNITDDFFEVMKKSPYLSNLEDLILKEARTITEIGYKTLTEINSFQCLRSLTFRKTSLSNKELIHIANAEFCETLEKLDLSENFRLDDDGFSEFFKKSSMKYLRKLYLSWNRISDFSLQILFQSLHYPSLKKIKLIKCPVFEYFICDESSNLRSLCKLDLSKTLICEESLIGLLTRFPNFKFLYLSQCNNLHNLDLKIMMMMGELKFLKKLDVGGLNIFPTHLDYFLKNSRKLVMLNISKNPFIVNPTVCDILKFYPGVFELNFSHLKISDEAFKEFCILSSLSSLRNLYMKHTRISDKTLSCLFEKGLFPELRILDVSWTEITDIGVKIIASNFLAVKLYDLNIAGCSKISDKSIEIVFYYAPLSYLKRLNLSHLHISSKILTHQNFTYLKGTVQMKINGCDFEEEEVKKILLRKFNKDQSDESILNIKENIDELINEELLSQNESDQRIPNDRKEFLDFANKSFITENKLENLLQKINFCNLCDINLDSCDVSDKIVSVMAFSKSLKKLTKINFNNTRISDKGLFQISVSSNFKNLKTLEVADCEAVTDTGVLDILKSLIMQIEYLNVTSTGVSDKTLEGIIKCLKNKKMGSLKEIYVYLCNKITLEVVKLLNNISEIICYY